MSAKRSLESDLGDLVDPSFDAPAAEEEVPQRLSHPNNPNVLVGGGEREARVYVPPTSLPQGPALTGPDTSSKVAISSSVDPRRMPTVRISQGRSKPPPPGERPAPPEGAYGQVVPKPPRPPAIHEAPLAPAQASRAPAQPGAAATSPAVIWILAVTLAALIGAGAALYIRKSMMQRQTPAPAPTSTGAPASTSP
jgi:hypothetical protein